MKFKVPGMMCMHCVKSVTDALESMAEVSNVRVDLSSKEVSLEAQENLREKIISTIEDLGFDVE
ncbi:MAG: heavy-metal-associated domain-containing protein [Clostridia bacterium]|nr:heavy-metal-associated domain-containing protein [Clostridia bacterium]